MQTEEEERLSLVAISRPSQTEDWELVKKPKRKGNIIKETGTKAPVTQERERFLRIVQRVTWNATIERRHSAENITTLETDKRDVRRRVTDVPSELNSTSREDARSLEEEISQQGVATPTPHCRRGAIADQGTPRKAICREQSGGSWSK